MEAIWTKPVGFKNDTLTKLNRFSNRSRKEVIAPSYTEIAMLGFVVILFFIPLIWHFTYCALLSVY